MADDGGEEDCSTRSTSVVDDEDFISSLPDAILQHILSFLLTKYAIRTSVLSKRWKHIWSETPSLSIIFDQTTAESINKTLTSYTAPKITSFDLVATSRATETYFDRWIEFAMSKDAENLNLSLSIGFQEYSLPDFFYINSSVKQLSMRFVFNCIMFPGCIVSWTSLRELCLIRCHLHDESIANIISGCPMLESLMLFESDLFKYLDLSRSLHLRKLEIARNPQSSQWLRIVAPHIHYLELINSLAPCTLVDVSSLAEANIDIWCHLWDTFSPVYIQNIVPKMLGNFQDVEKLTFGSTFLQILSLGELFGVSFPMLKIKTLTLETMITRSVIPSVVMLLQNSPELKKLIVHIKESDMIPDESLDNYLEWGGLNPIQCWRSIDEDFPTSEETISSLTDKTIEPNS